MGFFSEEEQQAFAGCVGDLNARSQVQRLRQFRHHRSGSRYDHVVLVAYLSFVLARRFRWDSQAAARAGLLHDLFWCECDRSWKLCMHHPEQALENANKLTQLSPKEQNIILSHMWPVGRHLPRYREAWLVDAMDDLVAILDMLGISRRLRRRMALAVNTYA
ncbi:MAG: phosphohydrolase [Oscillospiraceae bacterium]|nr:phosphohydrolase [Oscillospiraceae bacterium]